MENNINIEHYQQDKKQGKKGGGVHFVPNNLLRETPIVIYD